MNDAHDPELVSVLREIRDELRTANSWHEKQAAETEEMNNKNMEEWRQANENTRRYDATMIGIIVLTAVICLRVGFLFGSN